METDTKNDSLDLKTIDSFPFDWEYPPNDFELNSGHFHIWKVKLDNTISQKGFRKYLSTDEQLRAARIVIPEKRRSFQFSRLALRKILSIYTGQTAGNIQFNYGLSGKPFLVRSGQISSIEFNISHSADLMIAVFTKDKPVGVDLEYIHPIITKDRAVEQFFSKNDRIMYRNLLEDQKQNAFFSAWTKKEAYGKVIGTGFSSGLQSDHFEQGSRKFLSIENYNMSHKNGFWYIRFTPQENYTAVAAIRSFEKPLPCFFKSPSKYVDK